MEQQEQFRWWRPTRRQLLWAGGIAIAFLIIVICGYLFRWEWTGLVKDADYHKRTLWDWLKLLIVPAVLALRGFLFNLSLNKATQRVADQRTQDEALQAYLGKMSELLIDEKLHEKADRYDEVRVTARAQTLTVLGRLDADHKKTVLLFLREARLINRYDYRPDQEPDQESKEEPKEEPKSVFDTVKSVFGKVQASLASRLTNREPSEEPKEEPERLYYAQYVGLEDADLSAANLKGARLINTDRDQPVSLKGAILEGTDLQGADLEGADLQGADLSNADLSEADLSGANLYRGNLYRAELSGADLRGAKEWTAKQLAAAESLAGATMPDGEILKGPTTPDEPTFDDWRAFFHHRIP